MRIYGTREWLQIVDRTDAMDGTGESRQMRRDRDDPELVELKLLIPRDLYRAFQRCVWIRVHETGRDQLEIMYEMIEEFLVRHGC